MEAYISTSDKVGSIQLSENETIRLVILREKSGKNQLFFLTGKEQIPIDTNKVIDNNIPFISFFNNGKDGADTVSIVGMYVPPEKRGTNFSDVMLAQFFQLMEQSGLHIGKTAQIKKPLLAAKLANIGFIPERSDMVVRILGLTREHTPIVTVERNTRTGDGKSIIEPKIVSRRAKNDFYKVVGDTSNSGKRVAIQTVYMPPGDYPIKEFIEENRSSVSGKIRLFPARVRRILIGEK